MINNKKAILLINVGTPESPDKKAVRKYLSEFLNDPRMIDMPAMLRYFLVNFIIVPFRAPKSAKLYKIMWNDKGSPLLYYTNKLVEKVNANLG
ncbi:MAG: ferrochelatase, partial [Bacteroidota bacterium]